MTTAPSTQKPLILWTIAMTALAAILVWCAFLVRDVLLLIYMSGLLAIGFSPIVRLIERQKALPIGTQTVTARFLGTVPLPGGAVTLTDTTYLESSATTTLAVSPLEVVRSAQASLKQLTGLTSTQAVTVGLAVLALQGALISPRWTSGGTRLDKQGDPVLLLINGAVKLLLTFNPKVPAVTAAIASLVGVDRALAQNEIADAVAAHGKAAKITLANAAFASADTAAAQGRTSTAVDLYRTAWLNARDALP